MQDLQVIEKILSDARNEAARIKKQAGEKHAERERLLGEELAHYRQQTRTLAEQAANDRLSHMLAAARMDISKRHLAEKTAIIDEVFDAAGRQLADLPDQQYRDLMKGLMARAYGGGSASVIIDKNEKRIDQNLLDEVARQAQAGEGGLELSGQRRNLKAGFILEQERITTNCSLDALLDQARGELETDLAKELFA